MMERKTLFLVFLVYKYVRMCARVSLGGVFYNLAKTKRFKNEGGDGVIFHCSHGMISDNMIR